MCRNPHACQQIQPPLGEHSRIWEVLGGLGGGKTVELTSKNNLFYKKVYVFGKVWMCRKSHACQQIQPHPGRVQEILTNFRGAKSLELSSKTAFLYILNKFKKM